MCTLSTSVTDVICSGGSSGSITITLTDVIAPKYIFTITGASVGNLTSGLINSNTYTFTNLPSDPNILVVGQAVVGAVNPFCFTFAAINESTPISVNANVTNASCNGTSTGAIDISIAGGFAPYSIVWSNGAITEDISNLTAGTYEVTITDNEGCISQTSFEVNEPAPVPADAGSDATICEGGNTPLNASGGVSYSWSPASGLSNPNIANPIASPLTTTNYTVTVTDINGCQNTDNVTVTVNPLPVADAGTDQAVCIGGSVNLNASGGISYSWSPVASLSDPNIANPVASPAATTVYTVTVTDANGCQNTDNVTVTVNPLPVANAGTDQDICIGSTANLSASGGVTYSWSPAATLSNPNIANPVANPTVTTTYTVTVTDASGCQNTDDVTITVNPLPVAEAGPDATICEGNNTPLNASGGVSYSWSPASGLSNPNIANPIASPLTTTNYTVTVTDVNGCQNTDNVTITVNPLPVADAGADQAVCIGGSVNLNASGGISYSWSPAASLSDPNIANPVASPAAT
ncbi:MAG TPA: hypothetical protein VIK89_14045, partial [Cytophagaceae bacterium]